MFSLCVFMKTSQIICLYDLNKCAISCLVFCLATGKVFSMIALLISIFSFRNCSRVSCREVRTGRSAGHFVNSCSSLSVLVLLNGHFVSVGLIGVMLYNNRNVVSFFFCVEYLLWVFLKHCVQSVSPYMYATFILSCSGVAIFVLSSIYAALVSLPMKSR